MKKTCFELIAAAITLIERALVLAAKEIPPGDNRRAGTDQVHDALYRLRVALRMMQGTASSTEVRALRGE